MAYTSALKPKLIYVFRINDEAHKGLLKIGEATMDDENATDLSPNSEALNSAARKRIDGYTRTAGIEYELLYTETAIVFRRSAIEAISDKDVHQVLERSGIEHKEWKGGVEWYPVDLETAKKAIAAAKLGQTSLDANDISTDKSPIILRDEQKAAIAMAMRNIKNGNNEILWNAKMRFGKTLTALQLIKDKQFKRSIILTHRPVVDKGWFEDFAKIFNESDNQYVYISKNQGEKPEKASKFAQSGKPFVYFASMQDLRGSQEVGGKFDKNDDIFGIDWEFVIIDEAHEGTQTELGKNVIAALRKDKTIVLHLSGTPFNIISGFKEEQIYTWDYVMEQKMKAEWDRTHFGDSNPYAMLPKLNIFTFDLGELMGGFEDEDHAFNFTEFFRVWTGVPKKDRRQMPPSAKVGDFIHAADILRFLNLITTDDEKSFYPYANEAFRNNFRHSLWMIPGVKEAQALSRMLKAHPVFGQFEIINVAGDGDEDEENDEALKMVLQKIGDNPDETRTITLSCGRLTTGVTVPAWTAVFMLAGSYSTAASSYMQTIFRVQSPAKINGRVKDECFVFDFAPDRTLKVVAEAARVSTKRAVSQSDSALMGDLLNFMPIISVSGTQMSPYNVERMLARLKEAYIDRVVANGFEDSHIYDRDALESLNNVELSDFEGLKKIIGETKASPKTKDIVINDEGFDNEQRETEEKGKKKRDLTEAEKQRLEAAKLRKKQREAAISILRGISIRIPLLMYGAETKGGDDVTLENFASLIDEDSWNEFMPKGVSKAMFKKFSKYYDKDIFREAGKRIRFMARKADELPVTERIERIAQIFGTFRNPDKETVLTPWRVVNMHLSDTIGGYCFFADNFPNEPAEAPRFVDQGKVTADLFKNSNVHLLEINSKSGLYPLYLAYSFFRCQCDAVASILGSFDSLTMEQEHNLWDKALAQNIFVVCRTKMAASITRRTLCGFRCDARTNIQFIPNILTEITENKEQFINQVLDGKNFWNANDNKKMKFDAIVGNPPYQIVQATDKAKINSAFASAVYPQFIEISRKLNPDYISIIAPSRWLTKTGQGVSDEWVDEMINSNHFVKLYDFYDALDCFNGVEIKGGINYFLYSEKYSGKCEYVLHQNGIVSSKKEYLNSLGAGIVIRDTVATNIIDKIKDKEGDYFDGGSFAKFVSPQHFFDKDGLLTTSWTGFVKKRDTEHCIKYYLNKQMESSGTAWIRMTDIPKNQSVISKHKIYISKAYNGGDAFPHQIIGKAFYGEPESVCSQTYLVVGYNEKFTKPICENIIKYMATRFFRYMVFVKKKTQDNPSSVFQFVPLQDFTSKSDIDWSKSICEIDKQLYKKYSLSGEEQAFIEGMIKEMD